MIRREFLAGLTGLSALAAAPAISFAQTPMNLGQQWDVIVIGSGLAGLSAALSASENGADRILVIEKLPVLGGHSRLSTGSFLAVSPKRLEPLGIHTSVDAVLEEMMEVGGGIGNKDLARLLLSQSDAAMDWLETHGLVWNPEPYVAVGSLPMLSERSKVSPVLTTSSNSTKEHANAASAFCMTSRSPTSFRILFPATSTVSLLKAKTMK